METERTAGLTAEQIDAQRRELAPRARDIESARRGFDRHDSDQAEKESARRGFDRHDSDQAEKEKSDPNYRNYDGGQAGRPVPQDRLGQSERQFLEVNGVVVNADHIVEVDFTSASGVAVMHMSSGNCRSYSGADAVALRRFFAPQNTVGQTASDAGSPGVNDREAQRGAGGSELYPGAGSDYDERFTREAGTGRRPLQSGSALYVKNGAPDIVASNDAERHHAVAAGYRPAAEPLPQGAGRQQGPVLYMKAGESDMTVRNDAERGFAIAHGYVPAVPESPLAGAGQAGQTETVYYADGSSATGVAPLPRVSTSGSPAVAGPGVGQAGQANPALQPAGTADGGQAGKPVLQPQVWEK